VTFFIIEYVRGGRSGMEGPLAVLAVQHGGAEEEGGGEGGAGATGLDPARAGLRRGGGRARQPAPPRHRRRQRLHPGHLEATPSQVSTLPRLRYISYIFKTSFHYDNVFIAFFLLIIIGTVNNTPRYTPAIRY
jgi:hypothetical protein